jgi:hypothetical protein
MSRGRGCLHPANRERERFVGGGDTASGKAQRQRQPHSGRSGAFLFVQEGVLFGHDRELIGEDGLHVPIITIFTIKSIIIIIFLIKSKKKDEGG